MQTEELEFSISGIKFRVGEIPYGAHVGKYVWSTKTDESEMFDTAIEAQQDAIRYVSAAQQIEGNEYRQSLEDEVFGTYEEQVNKLYKSTRL